MRVLHVDKYLRREGGGAGYMLDVAAAQRAQGDDVDFFSMTDERNVPATYEQHFAPHRRMEPPPGGVVGRAVAIGRTIWSRAAAQCMDEVLQRFAPDVVHLHNVYHQLSPSILQPVRRRGIPAVLTAHDYKLVCPTYRFLDEQAPCTACLDGRFRHAVTRRCRDGRLAASAAMALEARVHRTLGAYDHVSRVLCPSAFLRDRLVEGGFAPDRLVHLPLFVDVPAAPAGPRAGVVYAGRLSAEKGVDVLVRAVGLLPGEQLVVAGDGPARPALEEQARREAPGRVRFLGQLTKAGVLEALRAARVAVLPARWHENQPLSVLEAMACCTPVVTTDLGGLPELVSHLETGVVVPPEDSGALARALRHVAGPTATRLGDAGRDRALASFSRPAHLRGLAQVYAAVLTPERTPA